MIITKVLGLSSVLTGSKKAKIAILAIEIGVLAYALLNQNDDKKKKNKKKTQNY